MDKGPFKEQCGARAMQPSKRYLCPSCPRDFATVRALKRHNHVMPDHGPLPLLLTPAKEKKGSVTLRVVRKVYTPRSLTFEMLPPDMARPGRVFQFGR